MTAMRPLLRRADYDTLRETFRWDIPDRLNMAAQVCDDWAARDPDRVAIRDLSGDAPQDITYAALRGMADALALGLTARGVVRGDGVGVLRSQGAWCAAAHVAIWKIGAISIPLFQLFKRDALRSRLEDAGARFVVTDAEGDISIRRGSASMMLGYWNRPAGTAGKFRGDWMLTGDRGVIADGFIRFKGREDDVITSAGYRIGPSEIEDCLLTHDAVANVAVVGKPDPLRTEIVKAYVVVKDGVSPSESLAQELRDHVKDRLASYSYPREIAFLDTLPMTVTGKVIRKELKALAAAEVGR